MPVSAGLLRRDDRALIPHSARGLLNRISPPLILLALNVWVVWRLFGTEYLDQMQSIAGAFISLANYIEHHWPGYDWFPLWYSGMPFTRAYQPGLHYTVALLAKAFAVSPASAYHFAVGVAYALGAVALYGLMRAFNADRVTAFLGGLFFSIFSPSTLLASVIRHDVGGIRNARRLQALVVYGEGPNVTGLMLAMIGLALLHLALRRRKPHLYLSAALALAGVPAVNWTATMALLMALAAYAIAVTWDEVPIVLPRMIFVGALTAAFAFPFALPSTIRATFFDTVNLDDVPASGPARWIGLGLMLTSIAFVRLALKRAPFGARFASTFFVIAGWVVLPAAWKGIHLMPNPMRFHLALEIPMVIAAAYAVHALSRRIPGKRMRMILAFALFAACAVQIYRYHRYANGILRPAVMPSKIEYQEAEWLAHNAGSARAFLPGSVEFWSNAFADTPQMTGCCIPSLNTPEPLGASYLVLNGYQNDARSLDDSLLWLKAYAVQFISVGGPASREFYKEYKFPRRFDGHLPAVWREGDDVIYRVPERAPGLARVVRAGDLVRRPPVNGIDDTELRLFVSALDDPSLPLADFSWLDPNSAHVTGNLAPKQVLSIAVTWDRGWNATANGRRVPVRADGIGLIAVDPGCSGPCDVRLHWSAGPEPGLSSQLPSSRCLPCWRGVAGNSTPPPPPKPDQHQAAAEHNRARRFRCGSRRGRLDQEIEIVRT